MRCPSKKLHSAQGVLVALENFRHSGQLARFNVRSCLGRGSRCCARGICANRRGQPVRPTIASGLHLDELTGVLTTKPYFLSDEPVALPRFTCLSCAECSFFEGHRNRAQDDRCIPVSAASVSFIPYTAAGVRQCAAGTAGECMFAAASTSAWPCRSQVGAPSQPSGPQVGTLWDIGAL